jgi:hypothetical protein
MPPLQSEQLNHNRPLAVKVLQSLRRLPSPTSGLAQVNHFIRLYGLANSN